MSSYIKGIDASRGLLSKLVEPLIRRLDRRNSLEVVVFVRDVTRVEVAEQTWLESSWLAVEATELSLAASNWFFEERTPWVEEVSALADEDDMFALTRKLC
jgi:hypothetical protein